MGRYGMLGWCRPVTRRHREAALACLAEVGMADFAGRQISQLSGGQQQRVFLARALAQEARLYFMDEPFAGVDAATETRHRRHAAPAQARGPHGDRASTTTCRPWPTISTMSCCSTCGWWRRGRSRGVFTADNLRRTYGGRLALLDEATQALSNARSVS